MRHRKRTVKLNRDSAHRDALFRNMCVSMIYYGSIKTTHAKAKYLRPIIEKIITKAIYFNDMKYTDRDRLNSIASKSLLPSLGNDKISFGILVNVWGRHFSGRPGGYCRILKLGSRSGDCAQMALLQFVPEITHQQEPFYPLVHLKSLLNKDDLSSESKLQLIMEEFKKNERKTKFSELMVFSEAKPKLTLKYEKNESLIKFNMECEYTNLRQSASEEFSIKKIEKKKHLILPVELAAISNVNNYDSFEVVSPNYNVVAEFSQRNIFNLSFPIEFKNSKFSVSGSVKLLSEEGFLNLQVSIPGLQSVNVNLLSSMDVEKNKIKEVKYDSRIYDFEYTKG